MIKQKSFYKKTSRRAITLVFEMVGTMIQVLNPATDEFSLADPNLKQLCYLDGDRLDLIYVRMAPLALLK